MTGLEVLSTVRARLRTRRLWLVAVPLAVGLAVTVLGDAPDEAMPVAGPVALLGGLVVFLVVVGGWLGEELGSGAALFWIQTPHSPLFLYGARFLGVTAVGTLLAAAVPGTAAGLLAALGHGASAAVVLRSIPGLVVALTVADVFVWAAGGWGIRGDTWAGPLIIAGLLAVHMVVFYQPAWLGPLAGPARVVDVPVDELASTARFLTGSGGDGRAFLQALPWLASWGALGAVGVHVTARKTAVADRAG